MLIVEDHDDTRELLSLELSHAGYAVCAACDGEEALTLMRAIPFDVILTDYHMPRMDGLQLLRAVKTKWPQNPVIVVSAELASTAHMYLDQGAYACIRKPWEPSRLLEMVQAAVRTTGVCEAVAPRKGAP